MAPRDAAALAAQRAAPTFSVVVPTSGRPTLLQALESIVPQLEPGDEILVVCSDDHDWGGRARNSAIERARGTHLVFMDDDDVFTTDALDSMRRFAREKPDRIGIFRMRYECWRHDRYGQVLWEKPELAWGNVGSPMLLVPNLPEKVGRWDPSVHWGDWSFIEETAALQGDAEFVDKVVARIRPDRRPWLVRQADVRLRIRPRLRTLDAKLGLRRLLRAVRD
ncbi:MAG: glycosyltransferase family 2 protein [Gaiellaceae bacterium]